MASSRIDEMDFSHLDQASLLPHFKAPIKLRELAGNKRVIFEIDNDGYDQEAFLEDDDDGGAPGDEETRPVTESDPRAYAAGRKTRPLLESFGIDPEMSFDSFYDAEKMAAMKDVEGVAECKGGGVRKTIIRAGNGPSVPENCKVFVHYVICGDGSSDPFDSTISRGYPQCVDLRAPDIIPGLFVAIQSMQIREVAKVWIRSDMAYGLYGCPPRIAPSLDLHCVIEVLDIIEENQLKLVPFMSPDERAALEFSEIFAAAKELRFLGNGDYKQKAIWPAVKKYRKATNILEDYGTRNQEDQDLRQDLLYTLYVNLSACYLELQRPQQVCLCCQLALRSKDFVTAGISEKLYYRFAQAKLMLGHPKEAQNLNKEALRRAPKDSEILAQKAKIESELERENLAVKMTYTKIGKAFCSSSAATAEASSSTATSIKPREKEKKLIIQNNEAVEVETDGKENPPNMTETNATDGAAVLSKETTPKKAMQERQDGKKNSTEKTGKISPALEWEEYDYDGKLSEAAFLEPTNSRR